MNAIISCDIDLPLTSKKSRLIEQRISDFITQHTTGNVVVTYENIRAVVKHAKTQLKERNIPPEIFGSRVHKYFKIRLRQRNGKVLWKSLELELYRHVKQWFVVKVGLHRGRRDYEDLSIRLPGAAIHYIVRPICHEFGLLALNDAVIGLYRRRSVLSHIDTERNYTIDLMSGIMAYAFANNCDRLTVLSDLLQNNVRPCLDIDDTLLRSAVDNLLVAIKMSANNDR